jgi:hypothetical protein
MSAYTSVMHHGAVVGVMAVRLPKIPAMYEIIMFQT